MTTFTPFRLFQVIKYAVNYYVAENHVAKRLLQPKRHRARAQRSPIEQARVGYHVEERRGWDTRPEVSTSTSQAQVEAHENSSSRMMPTGHALQRETPQHHVSSPPPPTTPTPSPSKPVPTPSSTPSTPPTYSSEIKRLMADATLFTPRFIPPRNITVLCHGLYGFSTATPIPIFPSLKLHYWHAVLEALRERLGCKIMVVGVKGTGSIEERAYQMHAYLKDKLPVGTGINFVAHSMGGLDCRFLISHIKPETYRPLSLTMIGTPNRGSPFMDWCAANIGVGKSAMAKAAAKMDAASKEKMKLPPYSLKSPLLTRSEGEPGKLSVSQDGSLLGIPSLFGSSLTNYLLGLLDSPAYGNLTTHYLNEVFNPATADDPNVKYTSTAGRISRMSVLHPLWFPKLILDAAAERGYAEEEGKSGRDYEGNDGLVSVSSAKWGEWLGVVENTHHWDLRGEGGLFPSGGKIGHWEEGRPDPSAPGGWDWGSKKKPSTATAESSMENTLSDLGNAVGAKAGIAQIETLRRGVESIAKATGDSAASLKTSISDKLPNVKPDAWDMAQVGQVVDWVADFLPGTDSDGSKVGERQLADARKEKAKEERLADSIHSATGDQGLRQTGDKGPRQQGDEEKKKQKEKFDLARFYGGLMVKLREDGF